MIASVLMFLHQTAGPGTLVDYQVSKVFAQSNAGNAKQKVCSRSTPSICVRIWVMSDIQGFGSGITAVSYTHLDVYKRQEKLCIQ